MNGFRTVMTLAVVGLVGCLQGPDRSGVYWIELQIDGELGLDDCTVTITENYADGELIDEEDPVVEEGPVLERETTEGVLGVYGLLTEGRAGLAMFTVGDATFRGMVDGDTITVDWTDEQTEDVTVTSGDLYAYTEQNVFESTQRIQLTETDERGQYGGALDWDLLVSRSFDEDDEWDPIASLVPIGRTPADDYLEFPPLPYYGYQQPNAPDADDCEGERCTLTFDQSCTISYTLDVFFAGDDVGVFDAIQEIERDGEPLFPFGNGIYAY
ncbi:MAG: hypothetical protein AAF602_16050 [Myxococcota bacterium]